MENVAAERGCLASIVQHGSDAYIELSDIITEEKFSDGINQLLWKCIHNVFSKNLNKKFDYLTLVASAQELGLEGMMKDREVKDYLKSLKNCRCELDNVRSFGVMVFKAWMIRELKDRADQSKDDLEKLSGGETVDGIITTAESPILEFTNTLSTDSENPMMGSGATEYMQHLGENQRDLIGISTGMPIYDELIGGGLQRGDINFIAARMKTGKSSIADNVSLHISKNLGIPVLQLDTEMRKQRHQIRLVSNLSEVPQKDIKKGRYYNNDFQKEKVLGAASTLEGLPFFYKNIAGMNFADVISYIRRWIIKDVGVDENGKTRDCVLIYDYFKLCGSSGLSKNTQEYQLLGFQLMDLINLILKYDISCLAFGQQNRQGIDGDDTGTIGGSDRIAQYVGSIALFSKKTPEEVAEDGSNNGSRKMKVLEARDGEPNDFNDWINIRFQGSINRITELSLRSQQSQAKAAPQDGFDDSEPLTLSNEA